MWNGAETRYTRHVLAEIRFGIPQVGKINGGGQVASLLKTISKAVTTARQRGFGRSWRKSLDGVRRLSRPFPNVCSEPVPTAPEASLLAGRHQRARPH